MDIKPEITRKPAFKIVGVERYTTNGIPSIQEAWSDFQPRFAEVLHKTTPPIVHGFEDYSRDLVMTPGEFPKYYYIAGVSVDEIKDVPEGMTGKEVPAAEYAIFSYRGELHKLHEVFRYIYETWLPNSDYKMDPAVSATSSAIPKKSSMILDWSRSMFRS